MDQACIASRENTNSNCLALKKNLATFTNSYCPQLLDVMSHGRSVYCFRFTDAIFHSVEGQIMRTWFPYMQLFTYFSIAGKSTIYSHSHLLGGRWRCVHIDDPRSPRFVLPSWKDCIGSKPSQIIGAQIRLLSEDDGDEEDIPDLETDEDTTSGDSPQLMVRIPVCKKRCVWPYDKLELLNVILNLCQKYTIYSACIFVDLFWAFSHPKWCVW